MVGERLKHYKIETLLGKGGMGEVYRAEDQKLHRPVALKVLSRELTNDPDRRRRFLQEARAAARLTHPSIAQVYDVDEEQGITFIAMELVEGKTIRQLILDRELDLLAAIDIALQVSGALAKAHETGIIHRDVKSENVILSKDGQAKILDFGLAKLLDPEIKSTPADELTTMKTIAETQAGMVMGTVAYMSPEQARGRTVDHRSDIFSLGVMVYEMATGTLPFKGTSPLDTMHAIAFEETRPMTAIRQNLPVDLQRIVSRCLRKRPEDRYTTALELSEDLKVLKKDTESGKIRALSVKDRVRERMESLRNLTVGDYAWYAAGAAALAFVAYLVYASEISLGLIVFLGIVALLSYRFVRNRPRKLLRRFAAKAAKIPEVSLITEQGNQVTVIADQATAALYMRVNALMEEHNRKLFFAEPRSVLTRDFVSPEELDEILAGPGILYIREDIPAQRSFTRLPPAPTDGPQVK